MLLPVSDSPIFVYFIAPLFNVALFGQKLIPGFLELFLKLCFKLLLKIGILVITNKIL